MPSLTRASTSSSNSCLWLHENCWRFGFILRYPAGKEDVTGIDYESWHYRYVGIEAARYLTEQQLTLDEFWAS